MPLPRGHILRTSLAFLALFAALGCSAAGLELQNYAFYGASPTPDGGRLRPVNVLEKVSWTAGADTLSRSEGEFRIDTIRINGQRNWLISRSSFDSEGRPVLDSIWMDRYTLHTIKSVRTDHQGVTTLEYNRRGVRSQRIAPDGKRSSWRGLHEAEPYGLLGVEVILGALPMRLGAGGSLAVVSGMGDQLQWLHFQVVDQTQEPRSVAGGVIYRPVWLVQARLDGQSLYYWVDADERAVLRRTGPGPDRTQMLVMRGPRVPRVNYFPVEPIGGAVGAQREITRVIGQGNPSAPMGGQR